MAYVCTCTCMNVTPCIYIADSMPCPAVSDFRCNSTGTCIHQAQLCDGTIHCSDGSDEINCGMYFHYFNCCC